MNGAIRVSWGQSIPGREAKGLEVFASAVEHFEGLHKAGRISAHQEFFSVTGADGGFMLATGELSELLAIVGETETIALNAKAATIVADFTVGVFMGGTDAAVQEAMGTYVSSLTDVGYL